MGSKGLTGFVPTESADARNPWTAGEQINRIAHHRVMEQENQRIAIYIGNSEKMLQNIHGWTEPAEHSSKKVAMSWSTLQGLYDRFGIMRNDATADDLEVMFYQVSETLRLFFTYPLGLEKIHVASAMDRLHKIQVALPAGDSRDAAAKLYDEYVVKIQEKLIPGVVIDHLGEVARNRLREIMESATRV